MSLPLIERVLELDAKATPAPWIHEARGEITADGIPVACIYDNPDAWDDPIDERASDFNYAACTEYRTAAPKLARALRTALDALEAVNGHTVGKGPLVRQALADIRAELSQTNL